MSIFQQLMKLKNTPENAVQENKFGTPYDYRNVFVMGVAEVQDGNTTREAVVSVRAGAGTLKQHGNIMVVGGPGSGKGRLITANLLSWGHSAIVVDLKGETYRYTANARKNINQQHGGSQVVVLDSRYGTGTRYNPLAVIPPDERSELADELISVTNDDMFWSSVARDMWLCCWAAADHAGEPHMPYAVEVMKLDLPEAIRYLLHYHKDSKEVMQHLIDFMGVRPNEEQLSKIKAGNATRLLESMWKTIKTTMTIYDDPIMLNMMNGHEYDPGGMFYNDGIATVYIIVPEAKPKKFMAFSRLMA